jgi:hypothetical protein
VTKNDVPFRLIIAPSGRTKPANRDGTPKSSRVTLIVVGSVAAEELVDRAVTMTGMILRKKISAVNF